MAWPKKREKNEKCGKSIQKTMTQKDAPLKLIEINLDHKKLVKTPQEMWIDELISYLRTKTTNLKLHCTLIYKKPKGFHWFSLFSHCQSMTTEFSFMNIRVRYLLLSERIF